MVRKIVEFDQFVPSFDGLSQEQLRILAVIFALLSFIIILILYKCFKHLRKRRTFSHRRSTKLKNIVLVNNQISKPDLKPISQQFQINTAYASQGNFSRLYPYYNAYSSYQQQQQKTPASIETLNPAFYYDDTENATEKNPSFNPENNIYLSKKFINLNKTDEKNQSILNLDKKSTLNSTDSSDPKSEESDTEVPFNRKSQRLTVAKPVSMEFNLLYSSKDRCLYVEILNVNNLVVNAKHSYYYVKMSLRDQTREQRFKSQKTKLVKGLNSVCFNETKQYSIAIFEKIADYNLQLSVYNRIRSLSRKQLVGDILVDLSRPDLSENFKLMFEEELTPVCLVSGKKLISTYCTGVLGFLKLDLQLVNEKVDKHKIKVTIKCAKNLPLKYSSCLDLSKSNSVFMGHPEFYLVLSLFYGQKRLDVKETASAFSNCPVWNQQIVFEPNEFSAFDEKFILDQNNSADRAEISRRLFRSKLKHLSLQITVEKGNFYSKHASIGQIKIGDKGSIDGVLHWTEMCNTNKSVCKWHEIRNLVSN